MTPMLEGCSLAEDEGLQIKWAALIANTVSEGSKLESTLYSHILGQLSSQDAIIFDRIFNMLTSTSSPNSQITIVIKQNNTFKIEDFRTFLSRDLDVTRYDLSMDNLLRLRLIKETSPVYYPSDPYVELTDLGWRFYPACTFAVK